MYLCQKLPPLNHYVATLPCEIWDSEYFIFQQDWAQTHPEYETTDLLSKWCQKFIPRFLWPSNSPDPNRIDYSVCSMGILQDRIYKNQIKDVELTTQQVYTQIRSTNQHNNRVMII